jgi:hypothetical protein
MGRLPLMTTFEATFANCLRNIGYTVTLMQDGTIFASKQEAEGLEVDVFGNPMSERSAATYRVSCTIRRSPQQPGYTPTAVSSEDLPPAKFLRHHDTLVDHLIRRYEQLTSVLEERLEDGQEE